MARFKASPEILAEFLDLPEGVEIIDVRVVSLSNGAMALEFITEGGGLPDAELALEYTSHEDGRVSLSGYSVVE